MMQSGRFLLTEVCNILKFFTCRWSRANRRYPADPASIFHRGQRTRFCLWCRRWSLRCLLWLRLSLNKPRRRSRPKTTTTGTIFSAYASSFSLSLLRLRARSSPKEIHLRLTTTFYVSDWIKGNHRSFVADVFKFPDWVVVKVIFTPLLAVVFNLQSRWSKRKNNKNYLCKRSGEGKNRNIWYIYVKKKVQ